MRSVHRRFDLERWVGEFPLERRRREIRDWIDETERLHPGTYRDDADKERHAHNMEPGGDIVIGPASMAYVEQLRQEAGGASRLGTGLPTDIMVWAKGEPEHPAATKTGGVPFRPAGEPWPRGRDGGPSEFLGQICFADSRDILRDRRGRQVELPGDVLLIFAAGRDGLWDSDKEDPTCLQHEWWPLATPRLMTAAEVPEGGSLLEPCYAELHRTLDYPDVPRDHPILKMGGGERLCVLEGGKIGGAPRFVQDTEPRPGSFIAAMGSINPAGPRFPLINVPVNLDGEFDMKGAFLMFGDCGSLYLFVSREGLLKKRTRLHWTVQGY